MLSTALRRICRTNGFRAALGVLLALTPLVTSGAQRAELREGARVRLIAPGVVSRRVEGVILSVGRDTLSLAPTKGAPLPIAMAAITDAQVYRGKSVGAGAKKGALWGAGVGLVVAVGIAATSSGSCPDGGDSCKTGAGVASGAVYTGISVGLVGALIGAIRGSDRWEQLTLR
jgi:hypothetical protein